MWQLRPLAYRMKAHGKFNEIGRFFRLFVQASPQTLDAVSHRLKVSIPLHLLECFILRAECLRFRKFRCGPRCVILPAHWCKFEGYGRP